MPVPGEFVQAAAEEMFDGSERRMRAAIAALPDGDYTATTHIDGFLDDPDPARRDLPIQVTLRIRGDEMTVDLAGTAPGVLTVGPAKVGDVICFEVAYDDVVRDTVREGAQLLAVQTNNATYMGTGQVEQQFAISRLRAIETGRPVVVAATNGVTGVVDQAGRVLERAPVRTQTVVVRSVLGPVNRPWALDLGLGVKAALVTISVVSVLVALGLGYRRRSRHEQAAPRPTSVKA